MAYCHADLRNQNEGIEKARQVYEKMMGSYQATPPKTTADYINVALQGVKMFLEKVKEEK
jgi:hypothetical protein